MEINDIIKKVEASAVYTDWRSDNPDYYLVHYFMMSEQPQQIGYYSEEKDNVVSFVVKEDEITMNPPEESFKKGGVIPGLMMEDVKLDINEGIEAGLKLQKDKYSDQVINKHMVILQVLEGVATYNVTLISTAFNFINIRIKADDGSVISEKMSSILDLRQEEQGM